MTTLVCRKQLEEELTNTKPWRVVKLKDMKDWDINRSSKLGFYQSRTWGKIGRRPSPSFEEQAKLENDAPKQSREKEN